MRTPESTIKAAILHPVEEIRSKALAYFARSHTEDETIMPLVIQAVEKYGREEGFGLLRQADDLPQTEATIQWVCEELGKEWNLEEVAFDNYCFALALILCSAQVDLLRPEMLDLRCFPEELWDGFQERLDMATWTWQATWSEFEKFGREVREQGHFHLSDIRFGSRLIEVLARHPGKAELLLPLLQRKYRGYERNLMEWLEQFLIELAGRMRLKEAIPILVERLHEDELSISNSSTIALRGIGGDEVVQALVDQWEEGSDGFRLSAAEILGHIHTDLSVQKCVEFFTVEEEDATKDFLANALLRNFVPEAVERVRQMVMGEDLDPDLSDLRVHLVAASTIMGVTFPEYQVWYKEAEESNWGWGHDFEQGRIRENFEEEDEDYEEDLDEEELEYEDWEEGMVEEDDYDEEEEEAVFGRSEPIRREQPRIGRNDPCPCGSGKKYKKCCMKKDS